MELKKSDIGAEIISILTRGMYLDPLDALREYVQNGVDAKAKNIFIKIRQNTVVIEDDGEGMNATTMRKAIRLGVSDKNPAKDVGFMGIGLYSSFHLCDKLLIYSKTKNAPPSKLAFDFKPMRNILDKQKKKRFEGEVTEEQLVDLQTLLEDHIGLETLREEEFTKCGTRVEMVGVEPNFYKTVSKFDEVSEYLQQVVPLPFNPDFKWGKLIEKKIEEICQEHNAIFELINLNLQVNEKEEYLYRPYLNSDFGADPLKPNFYELKEDNEFFGVAWGCLNPIRRVIRNKNHRGFLIKKQGFAIGKRHAVLKYFGKSSFFNRYIGEIIVVHQNLLTNSSRTDFEFSTLRVSFYDCLRETASKFNVRANRYQEYSISDEETDEAISYIKETRAQLNFLADDADKLLTVFMELKNHQDSLKNRLKRGFVRKEREEVVKRVIKLIGELLSEIRKLIEDKKKKKTEELKSTEKVVKDIKKIPQVSKGLIAGEKFKNLVEVVESLGIDISEDLRKILELLDEQFIQVISDSDENYLFNLKKLKQNFDELFIGG